MLNHDQWLIILPLITNQDATPYFLSDVYTVDDKLLVEMIPTARIDPLKEWWNFRQRIIQQDF